MAAPPDAATRLRVLECWLPLAQALNASSGWGANAPALEAIILAAAPALAQARTDVAARAILWHYYTLLYARPTA